MLVITIFIAAPLLRDFELGTDGTVLRQPDAQARLPWSGASARALLASSRSSTSSSRWGSSSRRSCRGSIPARLGPLSLTPYLWTFARVRRFRTCCSPARVLALLAVDHATAAVGLHRRDGIPRAVAVAGALMSDIQYDTIGGADRAVRPRALVASCATGRRSSATPAAGRQRLAAGQSRAVAGRRAGDVRGGAFALFRSAAAPASRKRKRARAEARAAAAVRRARRCVPRIAPRRSTAPRHGGSSCTSCASTASASCAACRSW